MRELRQDWRDIFGSFRVAFDVWKLLLGFVGVVVTVLVLRALLLLPASVANWVIALIIATLLLVGLIIKFALSDTGFTVSKVVMLLVVAVALAGVVVLCALTDTAGAWGTCGGITIAVLAIWALFGGAITRVAAVEIATDDRIGLGEALSFARGKYGAYLGATVLPAVAVMFLALSCALFGLLLRVTFVNFLVTLLFFFLVPLAGFLMFLIGLGGMAGAPLMYPAVSSEGNDSFDAISRAYSYVFGRPWRYVWYNLCALVYGLACVFFVGFFVKHMLGWAFAAVNYGSNGFWNNSLVPRLESLMRPLNNFGVGLVETVQEGIVGWDVTGWLSGAFVKANSCIGLREFQADGLTLGWAAATSAVIIAIVLYVIVGLVIAYVISLFFSMQTTIYLLLRKAVDGAEMSEVYREEDEEDYLSVTPEAEEEAAEETGAETAAEETGAEEAEEEKPKKKRTTRKKKEEKQEDKSE